MQDSRIAGYASLGADINKQGGQNQEEELKEGVVSEKLPELTLTMSDEELTKLTQKWEKAWKESSKKTDWEKKITENEKYWLGKQFDAQTAVGDRPLVDNLIFESLETFLPQATRRNPEPLVTLYSKEKETEAGQGFVYKVKRDLADLGDENKIRLKLKKAARHWSIYHVAVGKYGWDLDKDMPILRIIRPKKIILDPDATIDEDGYTGARVGEYRKMEASRLLAILSEGKAKEIIRAITDKQEGTEVQFIEWWTPEYMCWTMGKEVLLKRKNPHWNYDKTEEDTQVDDYGQETATENEVEGLNHFRSPRMPYSFMSVFNLGDRPFDNTGLIQQNLAIQDMINKRNKQIDQNADSMNGGMIVSMERSGLTKQQATDATKAIRKGRTIVIPAGSPRDAIDRFNIGGLPADVFNQLSDMRSRMRDIFGVKGLSQSGLSGETTVRGKIIGKSLDTDRIGGGVTEYLEQFADEVYNWFLQMLYVYDTDYQFIEGAKPPRLNISVKEGSLLPKDSTTIANQAIELAGAGKMSTIDLYKRLEYPDAENLAANAWLEINAPQILYAENPLVQQALGMQQQAMQQEQQAQGMPPQGEDLGSVPMEQDVNF